MKKSLLFILSSFLIISCNKDFDEINTNNNAPSNVEPAYLLRQVSYNFTEEMSYEGFVAGNLLGQYFTQVDFNLFDRHDLSSPQVGGNPWPVIYRNLRDNQIMLDRARSEELYRVYEGPGLIMKAYMLATLTDIYGDVPYFDALGGLQGQIAPAYNSQEAIYMDAGGVFDLLEEGINSIDQYTGLQALEGDVFYNGNLAAWRSLAQSLRIKYLMRVSNKVDVSQELQSIYDNGDYINSNSGNAVFQFSDGQPNNFRMANLRDGDFNLFVMSETMQEVLERFDDPRKEVFFRPIGSDSTQSAFVGLLNGQDASAISISVANYSRAGTAFRENTGVLQANLMTAWETYFFLAEAAQVGMIAAPDQQLYEDGVQMAFDYWNTALPADYLSSGNAAYGQNGADPVEQIITQKWLANTINGYEGWIEYRRTGFPEFKTLAASLNANLIPVKMPYPADEVALNNQNFVNATGGDNNINSPVWWDAE